MENKLPCIKCIVLPVCRTEFTKYINNNIYFWRTQATRSDILDSTDEDSYVFRSRLMLDLSQRCKLFEKYYETILSKLNNRDEHRLFNIKICKYIVTLNEEGL